MKKFVKATATTQYITEGCLYNMVDMIDDYYVVFYNGHNTPQKHKKRHFEDVIYVFDEKGTCLTRHIIKQEGSWERTFLLGEK